jgi:hypothetical protein
MEVQKSKEFEISNYVKNASKLYEKVTNIDLGEELPKIQVLPTSQIDENRAGFQRDNEIAISKKLNKYGRKFVEGVTCHEFFHWAIWKSNLENKFDGEGLTKLSLERNYRFALPLKALLIDEALGEKINSIEEGTAEFFAATLISKNEKEILINIFYGYFYENPSTSYQLSLNSISYLRLKTAIKEVYTTYQKFDESLEEVEAQIQELVDKYYKLFPNSEALHGIGRVTVLFAYEIYKKENKNAEELLRDLIYSPWEIVEKVVIEIKEDEDKKILKNAISDFEEGFKEHLRGKKENKKELNEVEEFKNKSRD